MHYPCVCTRVPLTTCYSYLFTFLPFYWFHCWHCLPSLSCLSRLSHCYSSSPPTGAVEFRFLWSLVTISSALSSPFSLVTRFLSCYCSSSLKGRTQNVTRALTCTAPGQDRTHDLLARVELITREGTRAGKTRTRLNMYSRVRTY